MEGEMLKTASKKNKLSNDDTKNITTNQPTSQNSPVTTERHQKNAEDALRIQR